MEGRLAMLAVLPGMDVARGLSVLRNQEEKYLSLIQRFVEAHAGDMTQLSDSLKRADKDNARLLAHTLKGTAATLGAVQLALHAAKLENSLRADQAESLSEQEMRTEMDAITLQLGLIAAALPAVTQVAVPLEATLDKESLKKLLKELDTLLAQCDTAAITLFEEHEADLRGVLGSHAEKFAREIRMFGFDVALELLRDRCNNSQFGLSVP
jgi:HPt (histidine-containing phosphotransfer) domain-containing protein